MKYESPELFFCLAPGAGEHGGVQIMHTLAHSSKAKLKDAHCSKGWRKWMKRGKIKKKACL